ncbi:MAG: PAS domain S-box protein [Alphaproteobacteria bacterium]|nr:PAS domain S-box protein [Alphaproteobacteria bacterium]
MPRPPNAETDVMPGDDSLFTTLIATAVDGITVIDERGIIRVFSQACERLFQYAASDVVGQNVNMLMPEPYREAHDSYINRYKTTGEARIIGIGREVHGQRKDGSVFPMYLSVGEGRLNGNRIFVGIIHDLTELYSVREARDAEKAFLASIVESSNDAIVAKTLDGVITSWNDAAERMFGYKASEIVGKPITLLFPPDRLVEESEILAKLRAGEGVHHYETIRKRKDGGLIDVSVTISPMRDASGRIVAASKTIRDITDRKAAEARLQSLQNELSHVARLTEMSQVSAAIAHELNQPLTAILNYTNVAKRLIASVNPASTPKAYEAVSKAGDQAVRAGQIIRRLRDFVEKRESNRTVEDINLIADDAIALGLIGAKSANIRTCIKFADRPPPIYVDRVQIQQVMVNLLRNAVEAMSTCQRRELTISTVAMDGAGVEVVVADTGPGIAPEIGDRLFKPFVTTKAGGMGIGLAISQTIIESHGGRLWMNPNSPGGTVFHFTIPAATGLE